MQRVRWLISFLIVMLLASVAEAKDSAAREREARKACLSGNYEKGVEILAELFVETTDTVYIYNQGRCFEQNLRYEQAIGRFQEFLRASPRATRQEKSAANKQIADCQALLARRAETEPAAPVPLAPPPGAAEPVPQTPAPSPSLPPVAQAPERPGAGLRIAGIITASVGGAALVTGLLLNLKVNSMASDLNKTDGYSAGKESDRKTYAMLGWVGYGVGAACVAAGGVLYYLGVRASSTERSPVAFVPAFGPGQAGAVLKGEF